MFLSFTRKISRRHIGLLIAFLMLFAPAFIASETVGAQRKNTKTAPTPKKNTKTAPTPKKSAKTAPSPKKKNDPKSKTSAKTKTDSSSKDKKTNKRNERNSASATRSNQKSNDKSKNSRRPNTKQALAEKNKDSAKNSKNSRSKETAAKNTSSKATKTKTTERRAPKTTIVKTTSKKTPKTNADKRPTTDVSLVKNETAEMPLPQIIVTTSSVPLRTQANPNAALISNVKLGTILKVTEKNPAWYKVQFTKDGKSSAGWISANSVNDLNAAQKEEIYRQIVERNYKPEMNFDSAAELYEFLKNASPELSAADSSAELELKRLFALRAALRNVPLGKSDSTPYREFLAAQDVEIVYNEPAGEWLVASNRFWDLHRKYRKSSLSDTIAWEAANNPLPGECEGYVNCHLFDMRMRFGEYLNLHPAGRHSGEALKNLNDYLAPIVADLRKKAIYNGPADAADRAEFNNLIAELRTIVSRLNFDEKEKTLQQLKQIAEAYR